MPPRSFRQQARSPRRSRLRRFRALAAEPLESRTLLAADLYVPLAGDWDGDGRDSLGLYNPASGEFYLRDINAPGFPHRAVTPAVRPADSLPLAGDWNGDGRDSIGLVDRQGQRVLLFGDQGELAAEFALASALPADAQAIAGDFNGDGRDDVAIVSPIDATIQLLIDGAWETRAFETAPPARPLQALVLDGAAAGTQQVGLLDVSDGTIYLRAGDSLRTDLPSSDGPLQAVAGDWSGQHHQRLGWYEVTTGIFTPWHVWQHDDLAAPLYAVPSQHVQAHVDRPLGNTWQNPRTSTDVDNDGQVAPLDALLIINLLNERGARSLPEFRNSAQGPAYFDTSGDNFLSPLDALLVINHLNGHLPQAEPEGEPMPPSPMGPVLMAAEVEQLLDRAAAASSSTDAIIAIVDRAGRILGVRAEASVLATIVDPATLVFAIDGAVAKARTAAFFANNQAPLTSRTVRFISQSTVTQREVESNPNIGDFNSPLQGPGFVAPIGLGGHFPPGVNFTPPVDLFAIEHTNRDSLLHPGLDGIKGTGDDIALTTRFDVNPAFVPMGQELEAPESYGFASGILPTAQSRGIATLPGGIPLYKDGVLVGGIGVFFPGEDGFATHEQNFVAGIGQSEYERTNAPKVLEAEWIAFATAGGTPSAPVGTLNGIAPLPGFQLPEGRIDLVGITLEIYGPHPTTSHPIKGTQRLLQVGAAVGVGDPNSGADQFVTAGLDNNPATLGDNDLYLDGEEVPTGWLVLPHAGGDLSAAEVEQIILQGIDEANRVRAAIRLPLGSRTQMVFAVADRDGDVLGLYRMEDATVFSIDVAVAKARNAAYYADAADLQAADQVDDNDDGISDLPLGAALTARTFRFLAEPRFPAGIDGTLAGDFSILRDPGINPLTAENVGAPLPASAYTSVLGFDAFHVGRNFRDTSSPVSRQNGVVFFPGSAPLYEGSLLVGGLGVSGDGVDQDDVVTFIASTGFETPDALRADQFFVRGTRLPYQKFLRNPRG